MQNKLKQMTLAELIDLKQEILASADEFSAKKIELIDRQIASIEAQVEEVIEEVKNEK